MTITKHPPFDLSNFESKACIAGCVIKSRQKCISLNYDMCSPVHVSDVHYTLAQTGSLCKTLASQRLFCSCGLSISCIMDFIVIIKKAHVQVTRSGDTKQK